MMSQFNSDHGRPIIRHAPASGFRSRPRSGTERLLVSLISTLLLSATGCDSTTPDAVSSTKPAAVQPVAVQTALVMQASVTPEITLIGTVTAIRRSIVGSSVEGRVTKLDVDAGDHIGMESAGFQPQGKPIAQLDTESVLIEIAAARAELTRLQHELAELETGSRPEEIAQAKARLEAARNASEYAESRFQRTQKLERENALSSEQLDTAKSAAFAARQELIAAGAAHDLVTAGPRQEQIDQTVAKVDQQQQEINRLDTQLRHHTIRAPFEGDVVKKLTEVGQWLTRGAPVAEIIELDPIEVVVHVPGTLVTQIRTGDKVPLEFDALPEGLNSFEGTIHGIVASADQRTRTFPVRIRLTNPTHEGRYLLRDGMQARAMISGSPRSTLLVPKDALILGGPRPVVMLAHSENSQIPVAVRVEVESGVSEEDLIEVRGDLQPGQHVIIDGNERVQPGQLLNIVLGPDNTSTDTGEKRHPDLR